MPLIKTSKVGMESYQGAVHGRKGTFLPSCKLGLYSTIIHEVLKKKPITEMFPLMHARKEVMRSMKIF